MELRHLRYFIAVAEELHFTRAAERLHIGQPPLSQSIQALEADIGAQLFARTQRSVRLTEAGKLFLADARRILALAEQASEIARRAQRGEAGELRIGFTFTTPLTPLFAALINHYRTEYPAVSLTLHEMATARQLEALQKRELDLAFIRPPDHGLPDNMEAVELRRDRLVAVLPQRLADPRRKTVALRELAHMPFVMYPRASGTSIYHQIFRLCRAAGFVPQVAQEAKEASTIIALVAAGCGVSVLPASFDRVRMDGVCYRPLSDTAATTALLLAYRKDDAAPLVDAFVALAREAAARSTREMPVKTRVIERA